MPIFRRSKKESVLFASNPGSRFKQTYKGKVQPDGNIILEKDDVIDIQEEYNAQYPMTTIDNILKTCMPGTDFSDPGLGFQDFTQAPKTLAEFMQLQIDQRNKFDMLPAEIKQKFDNDVNKFMMTAGEKEWFDKLGIDLVQKNEPVLDQEEVNKNES